MNRYTRDVLVVGPHPVERERLAAALEDVGFEVELCPGPTEPDHACLGVRVGRCPLASSHCVVVLDMDMSHSAASPTWAEELLAFYLGAGHRVVALSARRLDRDDANVVLLRRHPETDVFLSAVWWSASPYTIGSPDRIG